MQRSHGQFHVLFVDHDRGLDLRGGDHLDIDAFFRQATEHLAGNAHVAAHADADDGDLADLGVARHFLRAQRRHHLVFQEVDRPCVVVAVHGEAEVGLSILADVLDDHVDFDVCIGHRTQDLVGDAGLVGHAKYGNFGFVAIERNTGYDGLFHFFVFLKGDQGAGLGFLVNVDIPGRETGQHAHGNLVLAGEFDRADLQDLGAQARHLQHFLETHRL